MKPGRYATLADTEYHADKAINRGQLVQYHRSEADWAAGKEDMDSDALRFGRAVHTAVLEPDLFDPVVVAVKSTGTKTFKEALSTHAGELVVTEDEYDQISHMARAVLDHEGCRSLLSDGETEVSYFWEDEETGLLCKCRTDFSGRGYLVDLKTSGKPVEDFGRAVYAYHYDAQAGMYLDGAAHWDSPAPAAFFFIVVQKPPRTGVARWKRVLQLGGGVRLYCMSPETVGQGRDIYRAALRGIAHEQQHPRDNYADNRVHELHCIRRNA